MAASINDKFKKVAPNTGWQLNASGIADAAVTSFTLVSATGLPTDTAVILTVDRVDSSGTKTPSKMERIKGIVSGSNVISCVRGIGGTAQSHSGGAVVEIVIDAVLENEKVEGILVEHNQDGTHGAITTASAITQTQIATPSSPAASRNKLYFKTDGNLYKLNSSGTEAKIDFAGYVTGPQGFALDYKIVPSVASNNLTVALKHTDGTDASSTNPIYIRIGDTVRSITAALSVTKNAGTNWFNAGSAELATKEVDYFVYLGYNATDGVTIGFSRIPGANQYSDFSATTTNEKYCAISTITNAASTDYYENVGRFAATLSAGAGYTWTVPTFTASNLIQRPIYETRLLTWAPVWTGYSASPSGTFRYRVTTRGVVLFMECTSAGTSNATTNKHTVPFAASLGSDARMLVAYGLNNGGNIGPARLGMDSTATFNYSLDAAGNVWTASSTKFVQVFSGFTYEI